MIHKYVLPVVLGCSAAFSASSAVTTKPNPPATLCIDDTGKCADARVPRGAKIKWHPGHYVLGTSVDKYSAAHISELATEPNIVGWEQLVSWAKIEPRRGEYDWSFIDQLLALCAANDKRLIIQVLDRSFSGGAARLPPYLATEPGGNGGWYIKPTGGVIAKLWLPAIMDRLIALHDAMGDRYDADPHFEGVFTAESDVGFSAGPSDYSASAYVTQLLRLNATLPAYYPHTNVWLSVNFAASQGDVVKLVQDAARNRVGIAGPDAITANVGFSDWGSRVVSGHLWGAAGWILGGVGYHGKMAIAHDVESPELGGKEGGFSMQQIYDQSYNVNRDAHLIWERKDYEIVGAGSDLFWAKDILPWLRAGGHPTRTACPSLYTNGCDTD
jgi:hypothetical protein